MAHLFSDSINPTTAITSAPKKKKANRSVKSKQCKPDARQGKLLSQGVAKNSGSKEDLTGQRPLQCDNERKNSIEELETGRSDRGREEEKENGWVYLHFNSDSPSNSLTDISILSNIDAGFSFTGSSISSSGGFSGDITEDEVDDSCLDDWEAVADALAANDISKDGNKDNNHCLESISSRGLDLCADLKQGGNQITEPPKPVPSNCQAWRSDDTFRPQSLPNLSERQKIPNADKSLGKDATRWSCLNDAPSICPICCEELDGTDTSFLPCICSFQLCLFCYHRILNEEDGRCPGCRKTYEVNAVQSELTVEWRDPDV